MAAAVFLMSMPPGSISGVGRDSSSSGLPGWFSTAVSPFGTAGLLGSEGGGRRDSFSIVERIDRAQVPEACEVAIRGAQGGTVLDGQRRQRGIGHERAGDLGTVEQVSQDVPVALARI